MSMLLIDADTEGFTVSRDLPKLGYKGPESCEVVLDGDQVAADNLLGGEEGRGSQQVLSGLEIRRITSPPASSGSPK